MKHHLLICGIADKQLTGLSSQQHKWRPEGECSPPQKREKREKKPHLHSHLCNCVVTAEPLWLSSVESRFCVMQKWGQAFIGGKPKCLTVTLVTEMHTKQINLWCAGRQVGKVADKSAKYRLTYFLTKALISFNKETWPLNQKTDNCSLSLFFLKSL